MKTFYELLGVAADVSADEIKRAFRKEIARYHPDKVQHLGQEFQEIASIRAAELTEAYRVLMDEGERARYDQGLAEGRGRTAGAAPAPGRQAEATPGPPPPAAPPPAAEPRTPFEPAEHRIPSNRNPSSDFVRKAVLAKLREAIAAVTTGSDTINVRGIDAAYAIRATGGIFRKGEPAVRLLAKFVGQVDPAAIQAAWPLAAAGGNGPGEVVCLLLLGAGLAPSRDLSAAVAEQRRKGRQPAPVLVPVDVRDWEALFPPEAPASVRSILQRLRAGEA